MQGQHCTTAEASAVAKTHTLNAGILRCSRGVRQLFAAAALLAGLLATTPSAEAQTPATLQKYEHDKWKTEPRELFFEHEAFVLSFDDVDDDDGDGTEDRKGIPNWVSYEVRKKVKEYPAKRPEWTTDKDLFQTKIAPDDKTYAISGTDKLGVVKSDYRLVRGHMCLKNIAERISENAAKETHTLLNAVPQLQWQNNGIWKDLEEQCDRWADERGAIWVTCGPVFFGKSPAIWFGQNDEVRAAVPDALFKLVAWVDSGKAKASAYLMPHMIPDKNAKVTDFVTTVDEIEAVTGLDFFTAMKRPEEQELENGFSASL
jgi:DNA/RNA endonuclease G (NUC1)